MTLSVCVFCSSAGGLPEVYRSAARDLGAELAGRGHRLVYGGGNVGLMGEVARSVHEHGGTVVGVIPQGLVDRELAYHPADELLVTETLRERNERFCQSQGGIRLNGPPWPRRARRPRPVGEVA
ncbi:MAG TPA: LOG family protein, partial [Actinomycetes bacterium]|nr:LOG family protein [Actinomycetes bacterium]